MFSVVVEGLWAEGYHSRRGLPISVLLNDQAWGGFCLRGGCVRFSLAERFGASVKIPLGVGLAAGFVFAAGERTVCLVDENVIVAGGADQAVDGFRKLFVASRFGVIGAALFSRNSHRGS